MARDGRFAAPVAGALALLVSVFGAKPAAAHQDRMFELKSDGSIAGIPAKYGPAKLKIQRNAAGNATAAVLQLRGGSYPFPDCLLSLLHKSKTPLRLHGSWYHDRGLLPPYLALDVPTRMTRSGMHGHSFLFNLETAQLIKLEKQTVEEKGSSATQRRRPAYVALCGGKEPSIEAPAKIDKSDAREHLKRQCKNSDEDACYDYATALVEAGEKPTAQRLLANMCSEGHQRACKHLKAILGKPKLGPGDFPEHDFDLEDAP